VGVGRHGGGWRGREGVPRGGETTGGWGARVTCYIMYREIEFECVCVRERASGGLLFVARALVSLSSHTSPLPLPLLYYKSPPLGPGVYFWDLLLHFHMYPACISPYPWYPAVSLYRPISSNFAADPLYPAAFHGIQLYPYVSSRCI